jgi:cytochrome P450
MAGAVMNEQLRLIPPVNVIPKSTAPHSPQPITIDGKEYTIPANCSIGLHAVAVHRNPKYWPYGPARKSGAINPSCSTDNDLDEFKPERWLSKDETDVVNGAANGLLNHSADGLAVDTSPDTTCSFKPPKGAYIPFSEGARACLGRRFAQVEILAALAVIFSRYSIELSTEAYAPDEELVKMDGSQKREIWHKARHAAEEKFRNEMGTIITLQLRGEGVTVRICERGREAFDWGDEEL